MADIIAISKKLVDTVDTSVFKNKHVIEIENLMDGEKIGKQIFEVVNVHFKNAIQER